MKTTKKDNFRRLAELRVDGIINRLRVLGNLSNKSQYEYSENQVKHMFDVLREHIDHAEQKFSPQGKIQSMKFRLIDDETNNKRERE